MFIPVFKPVFVVQKPPFFIPSHGGRSERGTLPLLRLLCAGGARACARLRRKNPPSCPFTTPRQSSGARRLLRPEIEVPTCLKSPDASRARICESKCLHLSSGYLKRDFPPYLLLPYPAHVSYAYHARGIDRPGGAAISKTRSSSAAGHHVTLPITATLARVRWGRYRSTTGSAPGRNGPVGGTPEGGNESFAPAAVRMARGALQVSSFNGIPLKKWPVHLLQRGVTAASDPAGVKASP